MKFAFWVSSVFCGDAGGKEASGHRLNIVRAGTSEAQDDNTVNDPVLAAIQSGDIAVFETLYRSYYERLVTFVDHLLHDTEVARDVISDVFVTLWERRATMIIRNSAKSYLFMASRNRAFDYMRASRRENNRLTRALAADVIPGMGGDPTTSPDTAELQLEPGTALWTAVSRLNQRARTVIFLRWQENLSHAEIAKIVGISEDAVKKVNRRALATLARLLPDLLD